MLRGVTVEPGMHERRVASTRGDLEADGRRVFVLPPGIDDKRSSIGGIMRTLPLNPPLLGCENWDAMPIRFGARYDAVEADKVAILWSDSNLMASRFARGLRGGQGSSDGRCRVAQRQRRDGRKAHAAGGVARLIADAWG